MDGEGPRFGAMIALVAIVVATVILVFFGIGYALGRLFLYGQALGSAECAPCLSSRSSPLLWAPSPSSASRTTG